MAELKERRKPRDIELAQVQSGPKIEAGLSPQAIDLCSQQANLVVSELGTK